ncbi:MAG: NAD(P)H-binding protein, partial [Rhodobacteraceae bacterium]|nr:NAD(P)H-binding protein [Paracoccaceae bacterium]
MLGATGTAGQATLAALLNAGHRVICLIRPRSAIPKGFDLAEFRVCDITDPKSLRQDGLRGDVFDAVVSCLASRSGLPADAWAIDHDVHQTVLSIAKDTGIAQMVLLSAICVQKPKLEFQKAKLAFEQALTSSGLTYSIVRPTAFFKSLSGQFERVKQGKPFLVFGDGQLTACKPISDRDLGQFIARCLVEPELQNRVLPIGGPGPAL